MIFVRLALAMYEMRIQIFRLKKLQKQGPLILFYSQSSQKHRQTPNAAMSGRTEDPYLGLGA